jgi:hypothetical protein
MTPAETHTMIVKEFQEAFDAEASKRDIRHLWEPWLSTAYTMDSATILSKRRIDEDLGFSIQFESVQNRPKTVTIWRIFGQSTNNPMRHFMILSSLHHREHAFRELCLFLESQK